MNFKPDLEVEVHDHKSNTYLYSLDLKIKHFRQYQDNGRTFSPTGGSTVIFEQRTCSVFTAKCRHDENFSRKKGLLTCIQKLLDTTPFRGLRSPVTGKDIVMWKFDNGRARVFVDSVDQVERMSWL